MKPFLCFIALLLSLMTRSQQTCRIEAVRATTPIRIDGRLDDTAWRSASRAERFVEQRPSFGRAETEATSTEAFLLYDDNAVYIAGICREPSRNDISTELLGRDRVGINDFAGVMFDTYLDGINGVGFYVTALGEQYDCKYSLGREDGNWSTVYETATRIGDNGWTFEMRIPYAALRFSREKVQTWGVNFVRRRARTGQQFMWSPVDPNRFGLLNQAGKLDGIRDLKPPIRLSFSPYFSTYATRTPGASDWKGTVNGGMDVKYGISKGFTLDMTLVPDFGQVQSDNQILNLSPFEVRYNENRTFFTEGTELFTKGNFFYSRRVGGTPLHYGRPGRSLQPGEQMLRNPSETKLINATKVSGRTAGGLGIGFFNAITRPQHAEIETITKEVRKVPTDPLTNFNILVLDQTMKNNSSVSLVNTNVTRNGADYDANVAAALWDLYDKKVNWNFWGKVANSRLYGTQFGKRPYSGYLYEVNFGKFRGPFNFEVHEHMADQRYQQNDLGYFTNSNYINRHVGAWYKWLQPNRLYNNFRINFGATYSQRFAPRSYQFFHTNLNINSQLRNLWNLGINGNFRPEAQDFYEPRIAGKKFRVPGSWGMGMNVNTNAAKKYTAHLSVFQRRFQRYAGRMIEFNAGNQYRFNEHLTAGITSYQLIGRNEAGYAFAAADTSYFGLRDRRTMENTLNLKYNFNIRMGLNLRIRHYWSRVDYHRFFTLQNNGYLSDIAAVNRNPDNNVNFFNVDMIYTWQFAPGSFLHLNWKNAAQAFNRLVDAGYFHNLQTTLRTPPENSFSLKMIYFLDYLSLRKR